MRSKLTSLVAGVAASFVLAAGAQAQAPATPPAGLLVYSAQHAGLTQAWASAFTRETGIPVAIRRGTDVAIANQIIQEGALSPADVFLTENSPAMMLVESAGLFAPVDADTLAQVPAAYRPSSGKWTGIAARTTVFAYNTEKLTPDKLPKSILDLADAGWKGRWGAAPAGADFQAIVGGLLLLRGEEETADWLDGLRKNATRYRGNGDALRGVNAGEIDGAVIYHYYWFGDRNGTGENSKRVALHYFRNQDPGAFVSLSGGGVLASSDHPKEAQAFLKWITGPTGQAILRDGNSFEYTVGAGVPSNPKLEPLATLAAPVVDPSRLDAKKVVELMAAAGLL